MQYAKFASFGHERSNLFFFELDAASVIWLCEIMFAEEPSMMNELGAINQFPYKHQTASLLEDFYLAVSSNGEGTEKVYRMGSLLYSRNFLGYNIYIHPLQRGDLTYGTFHTF